MRTPAPGDPLSCVVRADIPQIDNAFDAVWAPDSRHLAISTILTVPNARTVTGAEEQQRLAILDVTTGAMRDLGQGSKPSWSGSGLYLSYWRDGSDQLRVVSGNGLAARIPSTQTEVRWVGDTLFFFHDDEIRAWKDGRSWTVAHVAEELAPEYPRDIVSFSADGERFTLTRYYQSGDAERFLGVTATGAMAPTGDGNVVFTQWAPVGHTLLLRSAFAASLIDAVGIHNVDARALAGPVHTWTADGRLLFGKMSPTVTQAVDTFIAFDDDRIVASLPNLLGVRAFSPDGRLFAGTSRTGLYSTQLDVFRCGAAASDGSRADTSARACAAARIASDPRRFVRPVSGAISQYLQGVHTGIDVSAPYGAVIVASDDGVVDAVGWVPVGGRRVCVLHAGGLESCDYHTSLPLVAIGDHVVRGQPVALVGMTGLTTGPHVHWEAKRDGVIVDPLKQ